MKDKQHCAVVGAGIVGICCAIELLDRGYQVTIYDSNSPGSMTSKGNAGGFGFTDVMPMASPGLWKRVPEWLLDPCGPLFISPSHLPKLLPWLWCFMQTGSIENVRKLAHALSSLLEMSKLDCNVLLDKSSLGYLYTELGAITVYKSKQGALKDKLEWDIKKEFGVEIYELHSNEAIREMEPELQNTNFGYYTPQWCNTTDPYELAVKLFEYFVAKGGCYCQEKVKNLLGSNDTIEKIDMGSGKKANVEYVVIAAGVWSKEFCKQLNEKVLIESERGYNTTLSEPGVLLNHQVIFGEEKFVISNIGNGLRIGGAAEFAGFKKPNYRRSAVLVEMARRYLPQLKDQNGQQWMGHRPTTPDSIPVIGPSLTFNNVFYAFGHGHYGLTMAPSTGKLIAEMISRQKTSIDIEPFSIKRFN